MHPIGGATACASTPPVIRSTSESTAPDFKEISAKYVDQKNADQVLAKKIRRGGTGVWGQDVMPPQPQVSAAEARALASYVLSPK